MRIVAGPNGSGKSTLINMLKNNDIHLGEYCNADDYKRYINQSHNFNFDLIDRHFDFIAFREEFMSSPLFDKANGKDLLANISSENNTLKVEDSYFVNDYFTSFLADYVRRRLLKTSSKFTFETVMSHPSKLEFMKEAKDNGFKVYLYFISLGDPLINVERVKNRVLEGGHDVEKEKIVSRYSKTMDNLYRAIMIANESYIFDNSHTEPKLFAIVKNRQIEFQQMNIPAWFNTYVLKKISDNSY